MINTSLFTAEMEFSTAFTPLMVYLRAGAGLALFSVGGATAAENAASRDTPVILFDFKDSHQKFLNNNTNVLITDRL